MSIQIGNRGIPDTIYWSDPGLRFQHLSPPESSLCKLELIPLEAGLTFSPGDTVNVCLLDVTDSLYLVGPANHLGTDCHSSYGPPVPYCWEFYISPTAVAEDQTLPEKLNLIAYPNPSNQTVKITYNIPKSAMSIPIELIINDILGRKILTLFTGTRLPGHYEVNWETKEHPSGLYFVTLHTQVKSIIQRIVLMK